MSQFRRRLTDSLRARIVQEAESWLNTPYHHRAHVKGAGVDCAWLLIEVFSACGLIKCFDPGDYPPDWMLHRGDERYLGWIERYARQVSDPLPGDIAIWRFGRAFSHAAIVVSWPRIIHAYRPDGGVVYGDASQGELARRDVRFYSLSGAV